MNNIAIIPAGGQGKRLSSSIKKQFIELNGSPVLLWTIVKFVNHPQISKIVVVFPREDILFGKNLIEREYLSLNPALKDRFIFAEGGEKRQDSVLNGLRKCPATTDNVLIHDAVRPFVSMNDIDQLLRVVAKKKAVIPVSPVKDTVKRVRGDMVVETLPREELALVYTPQVFDYQLILAHHEKASNEGLYFTDDAAILEHYGVPVSVVTTSPFNIKITDQFDLFMARHIQNFEASQHLVKTEIPL